MLCQSSYYKSGTESLFKRSIGLQSFKFGFNFIVKDRTENTQMTNNTYLLQSGLHHHVIITIKGRLFHELALFNDHFFEIQAHLNLA